MMKEVRNDILYFDGCDTMELAKKYGTPLYVISAKGIKGRFEELRNCFTEKYSGARVAYAAKAFFPLAMARLVAQEGMCVDVVSGGELYTAIKAGFPAERIEFNGNNKLREELDMAIEYGVGRIIVDGFTELDRIEETCREKENKANVLFRLTPGIDCHFHYYKRFALSNNNDTLHTIEQLIEEGMTPDAIMAEDIRLREKESLIRKAYFAKRYKETPPQRDVKIVWHCGESGTGKSCAYIKLCEQFGDDNVYFFSDYANRGSGGFDNYGGQPILFMDELKRESLPYELL